MSKLIFSQHGRLVPSASSVVFAQEDRRYFALKEVTQPIETIYANFKDALGETISISMDDFCTIFSTLLEKVKANDSLKGLLAGVYLPFVLPKKIFSKNYEDTLAELLKVLQTEYTKKFPQYEFKNLAPNYSEAKFKLVNNSRLNSLYSQSQLEDVVGIYFPNVFAGYAIHSQRALISAFPEGFALTGPIEIASSLIGYPSLLLRTDETYPNGLTCSGIEPQNQDQQNFFWYFEAYGWNLNFNYRSMVGPPSEYFSGGLSFF